MPRPASIHPKQSSMPGKVTPWPTSQSSVFSPNAWDWESLNCQSVCWESIELWVSVDNGSILPGMQRGVLLDHVGSIQNCVTPSRDEIERAARLSPHTGA